MVVGAITLIKDEQNFLEEWIIHNLGIGFDKLVIFEDNNSSSHSDICSKYSKVELHSITEICSDEELNNTENHQIPLYEYITYDNHYGLDWCAFIDIDEYFFGNFENIHKLTHWCDEHNYYQLWTYFTFMTCNGLVNAPKRKYNVKDVFTECNYDLINNDFKAFWAHHKCMLNLNKTHIWTQIPHIPITERNRYVCTDEIPYEIEFRHYLSKSYEEYVLRRLHKELMPEGHWARRNYETFWYINSKYKEDNVFVKKCRKFNLKHSLSYDI